MKIESININIPAVKGQIESTANNSTDANSRTAGRSTNGKAESLSALNIDPSLGKGLKDKQQSKDKQLVSVKNELLDLKAVFALDKEKNVVIRVLDKKGKIVRQYPPEEYIKMVKKFRENIESLFSKEV